MKKSELFPSLPDITFAEKDPAVIQSEIISAYENASGRTLSPADPVRLFLLTIADVIIHQRNLIDIAAKNNLIAYAEGDYLDHIGALFGVARKDGEDDGSLRERIHIAPEHYSTAGPAKAYEYYAMTADPDIIDVKAETPPMTEPGHVHIYPLMKGGKLPDDRVLDAVFCACADDTVRPDTDYVEVLPPAAVSYNLSVDYWIDRAKSAMSANIQANVEEAVDGWVLWQKSALGRDINPSELTARIIAAGAKRCVIHSPEFRALLPHEVASADSAAVNCKGLEDD